MDLRSRLERLLGDDSGWQAILSDRPAGDERPTRRPAELVAYGADARLRGTTDAAPVTPVQALGGTGRLELRGAFTESITDGSVGVSDAIALERHSVCAIAVVANADGPVDRPRHPGRRSDRIALEIGPYRIVGSLERGRGDGPGYEPGDGPGYEPGDGPGYEPGDSPGYERGDGPIDSPGTGIGRPTMALLTDAYIEWTVDGISVRECHAELAVNLELARWVAPARERAEEAIAFPSLGAVPAPMPAPVPVRVAAGRAAPVLVADVAV